jgi:hypothetical protein
MNQYLGSQTKNKAEKIRYYEKGMVLADTLIKVLKRIPVGIFGLPQITVRYAGLKEF